MYRDSNGFLGMENGKKRLSATHDWNVISDTQSLKSTLVFLVDAEQEAWKIVNKRRQRIQIASRHHPCRATAQSESAYVSAFKDFEKPVWDSATRALSLTALSKNMRIIFSSLSELASVVTSTSGLITSTCCRKRALCYLREQVLRNGNLEDHNNELSCVAATGKIGCSEANTT